MKRMEERGNGSFHETKRTWRLDSALHCILSLSLSLCPLLTHSFVDVGNWNNSLPSSLMALGWRLGLADSLCL